MCPMEKLYKSLQQQINLLQTHNVICKCYFLENGEKLYSAIYE